MSAPADLRTYLLAQSGVSTLIGTRMYPDALPEGATLPAVVYYRISGTHVESLGGIKAAGTCRVQLDAYAATRLAADAVGDALVAALRSLSVGQQSIGAGTIVCDVEIQGPRHDRQPPTDGSDEWEYICSVDALLWIS